jgi:hypothetical protein
VVVVKNQVFFIFLGSSLVDHNSFVLLCALYSLQARCCNGCGRRANQLGEGAGMLTLFSTLSRLLVYGFVALAEMGAQRLSLVQYARIYKTVFLSRFFLLLLLGLFLSFKQCLTIEHEYIGDDNPSAFSFCFY